MFEIKIFEFHECPIEAFQFRYKVYVEQMARAQVYANHEDRTIIDPMDATAHHGIAFKDGDVAAVIRLNFVRDGNCEPYVSFYEIDKLPSKEQENIAICSRNMTDPAYRNTRLAYQMQKLMFTTGYDHHVTTCYIDVNPHLVDMFTRVGFEILFEKEHPEYGLVTVMRLNGIDIDHLSKIKSPFVRECQKYLDSLT